MKKIVYFFSLIFILMLLLSSCDGFETKKYTITLDNEAYCNKITIFKFYVWNADGGKEAATNLLAGSPISYRDKKVFEGLAEDGKSYSWYIEYANGDTRHSRYSEGESLYYGVMEKIEADTTIKSDPGTFVTYRVKNDIGAGYAIHYIVLQPAGYSDECYYAPGDDYPYYDTYQAGSTSFKSLENGQSISIEDGEAALYDIYIYAWYADASRPGDGDYYVAVDKGEKEDNFKGVNLKRSTGYILTAANRWKRKPNGEVTYTDLDDGYATGANIIKLKNRFLQLQNKK